MINAAIPLQVRTPDFTGRRGTLDAIQVTELLDNQRMRQMQREQLQKQIQQEETFNENIQGAVDDQGNVNVGQVQNAFNLSGRPLEGMSWVQGYQNAQRQGKLAEIDYLEKSFQMQAKLLANSKDAMSWDRNYAIASNLFGEDMMDIPRQYPGQKAVQQMLNQTLTFKQKLEKERLDETKRHNRATEANQAKKSEGDKNNKTADANFFRNMSAEYYGGFVDPDTGRITGLDTQQARKMVNLAARANQLYQAGGIDQNTAFQMAADEKQAPPEEEEVETPEQPKSAREWLDSLF